MQNINTGYTPEFALGALYAGENAADIEQGNQFELLKQYLANARETQMQPLDVAVRGLEAAQANAQNTPELLQSFVNAKQAGYDKAIRENKIGILKQPGLEKAAPIESEMQAQQALQNSNLLELQQTIANGVDRNGNPISPQDMSILQQEYQKQIALRGETPELYGKGKLEDIKGWWDLEKQRLANQGHEATARMSADRGHQSEIVKSLTPVMGYLKNIDTQLAKLESKEMDNEFIDKILTSGKKLTPEQQQMELTRVKNQLRNELQSEKQRYQSIVGYMMQQIPGMQNMPQTPAPSQNVIKLD